MFEDFYGFKKTPFQDIQQITYQSTIEETWEDWNMRGAPAIYSRNHGDGKTQLEGLKIS